MDVVGLQAAKADAAKKYAGFDLPGGFVSGSAFGPTVRRCVMGWGGGVRGQFAMPFTEATQRLPIMLPVKPVRYRFRIANFVPGAAGADGTYLSGAFAFTGAWLGQAAMSGTGTLTGNYTATPSRVLNSFTTNADGTEFVTPWVTDPTLMPTPYTPYLFSFGWTSSATQVGKSSNWWAFTSGAGSSANAGNQTLAGVTTTDSAPILSFRIEYEVATAQPVGMVLGDSLSECDTGGASVPLFASWPQAYALQVGAPMSQVAFGGRQTADFANPATRYWTCWSTLGLNVDYAIIALGMNDLTAGVGLGTFQTNYATIVAALRAAGINRIYGSTIIPRSQAGGLLQAAASSGQAVVSSPVSFPANSFVMLLEPSGFNAAETKQVSGTPTGTGPYTVTFTSNLSSSHTTSCQIVTQVEGLRQQYNQWLRSLPLGLAGCLDFDKAVVDPANKYVPDPEWLGTSGNIHLQSMGYHRMAAVIPRLKS
jgi:hypothetical protein